MRFSPIKPYPKSSAIYFSLVLKLLVSLPTNLMMLLKKYEILILVLYLVADTQVILLNKHAAYAAKSEGITPNFSVRIPPKLRKQVQAIADAANAGRAEFQGPVKGDEFVEVSEMAAAVAAEPAAPAVDEAPEA